MTFLDSLYKKTTLPEPYDSEAKFSLLAMRLVTIFFIVTLVLLVVIGILANSNSNLSRELVIANKNKAMIGLSNDQGIFMSVDRVPDQNIEDFSELWVNNWKNLSSKSVSRNLDFAMARIHPDIQNDYKLALAQKKEIVKSQGVESVFGIIDIVIEAKDKFEYEISATGNLSKYVAGTRIGQPEKQTIELKLCGIEPTATFTLALAVCEIDDPEFK